MVDSRSQPHAPVFLRRLRDFRPDGLALTHAHVDHSGGAWIAARLGVPVYAHPLERPAVGRAVSRLHVKVLGSR